MHIAEKHLDVNCIPLSVAIFVGVPTFLAQCSKKIVATVIAVVFCVGISLFNFENQSAIKTMYWLPLFFWKRVHNVNCDELK